VIVGCAATFAIVDRNAAVSAPAAAVAPLATEPAPSTETASAVEPTPAPTPPALAVAAAAPRAEPMLTAVATNPVSGDGLVVPTPAVDPEASVAAPAVSTEGVILLPPAASKHRVYVDGKVIEVKNLRATVACGEREVRIGSRGTNQTLDVACGGETALPADPR